MTSSHLRVLLPGGKTRITRVLEPLTPMYSALKKDGRRLDRTDSCVVVLKGASGDIVESSGVGTTIEWTVHAVDASGNAATRVCSTQVVRPRDH